MRRVSSGTRKSQGMLAGTLSNLIQLQRKTSGKDSIGQPVETWSTYASVWADVRMLTGRETISSGTDVGTASASVRIRYRSDVTNGDRLIAQGFIFNIGAPLPGVAGLEYTDLPCTMGANVG